MADDGYVAREAHRVAQDAQQLARDAHALASTVNQALESHEAHCSERHKDYKADQEKTGKAIDDLKASIASLNISLVTSLAAMSEQFTGKVSARTSAIYNILWVCAGAIITGMGGVLAELTILKTPPPF